MFNVKKRILAVLMTTSIVFGVAACGLFEKKDFSKENMEVPTEAVNNANKQDDTSEQGTDNKENSAENSNNSNEDGNNTASDKDQNEKQDGAEIGESDSENGDDSSSTIVMPGMIIETVTDPLELYNEKKEEGFVSELIISEVMSSNKSYALVDGEAYDWVEVYNNSDETINLSDYYLTDKVDKSTKCRLPDKELKSGKYYVIYCSGLDMTGHALFKISSEGESLYLYKEGEICDYVEVPSDLKKDMSFGVYKGEMLYMDVPTPAKKNKKGYDHVFMAPATNLPSGLYDEQIEIELSGEGNVYYTLDGSRPDRSSEKYTKPIVIDGVTTIRTFCEKDGRVSDMVSYTYLVDVNHTLPVLTVSIPQEYLFGDEGIIDQFSKTIEKEAVMTLIENGEEKFAIPCGFRLHGNDSRKGKKQNFQIRFRSKYGAGKLHYKLFDDLDIDEFNSLLLKGGSEDYRYAMIRDELCTGIVNGTTELSVLACKPCVLYLGDEYWGIYYIRERFSADYVASHFGVSKESVDLLFTMGLAQDGSSKDYSSLVNYVRSHDLTVEEYYNYVLDRVEITSLMDWYICRSYMGDKDYANIRYFKSSEYDNKWRYMYFDLDWAFWSSQDTPVTSILGNTNLNVLIYNLMKNKDFQTKFIKRYAELMKTILNEEYITAELDRYMEILEPEIEQDRNRWGYRVSDWRAEVNRIYKILKDGARTENVLNDIKSYFKLSDKQMKKYFKGIIR